jgi:hypothetical protein
MYCSRTAVGGGWPTADVRRYGMERRLMWNRRPGPSHRGGHSGSCRSRLRCPPRKPCSRLRSPGAQELRVIKKYTRGLRTHHTPQLSCPRERLVGPTAQRRRADLVPVGRVVAEAEDEQVDAFAFARLLDRVPDPADLRTTGGQSHVRLNSMSMHHAELQISRIPKKGSRRKVDCTEMALAPRCCVLGLYPIVALEKAAESVGKSGIKWLSCTAE